MKHEEMIKAFFINELSGIVGKKFAELEAEHLIDLLNRYFTIERKGSINEKERR